MILGDKNGNVLNWLCIFPYIYIYIYIYIYTHTHTHTGALYVIDVIPRSHMGRFYGGVILVCALDYGFK